MRAARSFTALACLGLLLSSPVGARPPPDKNELAAREAAGLAKGAFERGDFAAALRSFEKAYTRKQVPGLLFNIAQCHRQLGNHEKAIAYFQRFLESGPDAAQAKATRELIATEHAKQNAAAKARDSEAEQTREIEVQRAREAAAKAEAEAALRRADLEAAIKEGGPAAAAVESKPAYTRWWFWGAIGLAAAAAATTAVVVTTAPRPTPTTFPDINAR